MTSPPVTPSTSTTAPACSPLRIRPSPTGRSRSGTRSSGTCGGGPLPRSGTRPSTAIRTPSACRGGGGLVVADHHATVSGLAERPLLRRGRRQHRPRTTQRQWHPGPEDHLARPPARPGRSRRRRRSSTQAVDARVWSGIHFRTADEVSIDIGSSVGRLRAGSLLPADRLTHVLDAGRAHELARRRSQAGGARRPARHCTPLIIGSHPVVAPHLGSSTSAARPGRSWFPMGSRRERQRATGA